MTHEAAALVMLSEPQNALYWPPDVAPYSMEGLVFFSSGWLRTACVLSALFWYRLLHTICVCMQIALLTLDDIEGSLTGDIKCSRSP